MMGDVAITVEGLGKMYRIGAQEESYSTLRESLVSMVAAPFKRLRKIGAEPPPEEIIWALKDVSFEVKYGEVIGIIGRNGAGKTTLLKILSRITTPTEGYADLCGRVGSLLEVGTGFHPELTGRENIYLNGSILGMKKAAIDRKFDEMVAFAEIEKFIDTPVKRYSSGMYVRLAFGVAAHLEPELLLVDEVLAVGDFAFQQKCLGKMNDVAREGRTVLFVSHNIGAVTQLCSLCLYLKNGQVESIGETKSIVGKYLEDVSQSVGRFRSSTSDVGRKASITEACVLDQSDTESSVIRFTQSFYLSVTYKVSRPIPDLDLIFRIVTQDGVSLLYTASLDYNEGRELEPVDPGLYTSRAQIPGHLLFPGKYYVDVGIETYRVEVHDQLQRCLSFDIVSEGEVNTAEGGWGLIYPKLDWTTEHLESD